MAQKLTDRLVRSLPPPPTSNRITYDTEVRGFGVRVTSLGAKAFVLNYRVNGRERRLTIGSYPDWSVAAAREQAKELKRSVDLGDDPMGRRHEDRAAPNVGTLATGPNCSSRSGTPVFRDVSKKIIRPPPVR